MQIRTILVPVDFSDHSAKALDMAIELAKEFHAAIEILHCYQLQPGGIAPYGVVLAPDLERDVREAASAQVQEWVEKVQAAGVEAGGDAWPLIPSEAIMRRAEELPADLIVIGTRGLTGLKHTLLGSVAERTVRHAPCPVLTVKA